MGVDARTLENTSGGDRHVQMKIIVKSFFLILIAAGLFTGCGEKKATQPVPGQAKPAQEVPDQEAWNSTAIASKLGHTTVKVKYGHMSRYSALDLMKFNKGVRVFIYDKKGKLSSTIQSERGWLNEKTNLVKAYGHVVAHSDSGITLYTNHLTYNRKKDKLFTDAFVKLVTESDTLYGTGFESDQNLNHWVIRKPSGVSSRPFNINVERHFRAKQSKLDSNREKSGAKNK